MGKVTQRLRIFAKRMLREISKTEEITGLR
jgi:hypothetical protein